VLEGELIKDPDCQNDKNGNPVCRFALASSRFFKINGGIEKETGYFNIEASGKLALQCKENGRQGRGMRVVGRLKQEHSRDAAGKPVARIIIVAEHAEFQPAWTQQQKQTIHNDEDYDMGR
jgi:single-strand DNA-binding protein